MDLPDAGARLQRHGNHPHGRVAAARAAALAECFDDGFGKQREHWRHDAGVDAMNEISIQKYLVTDARPQAANARGSSIAREKKRHAPFAVLHQFKRRNAFTLLELMLAMALMAIVSLSL